MVDLVTEQWPAGSLAFERAETALMRVPPRDLTRDRLVDGRVLRYAYLISGVVASGACLLAYFAVFWLAGITAADLWQATTRGFFQGDGSPPFVTAAGATFDAAAQTAVANAAHSAYFFNLVSTQAVNVFLCKTRLTSVCVHGPLANAHTGYAVFFAIACALFFVFMPFLAAVFYNGPINGYVMFM